MSNLICCGSIASTAGICYIDSLPPHCLGPLAGVIRNLLRHSVMGNCDLLRLGPAPPAALPSASGSPAGEGHSFVMAIIIFFLFKSARNGIISTIFRCPPCSGRGGYRTVFVWGHSRETSGGMGPDWRRIQKHDPTVLMLDSINISKKLSIQEYNCTFFGCLCGRIPTEMV